VYYCERDYFHDPGDNAWMLVRAIRDAQLPMDLRLNLQKKGLTHLLVREDLLERYLKNNLAPEQFQLWTLFAQRHLKALFQAHGYSVYQIYG
jgi:hypothetical protein